jgi:Tfp pilus assembly major pilin PilA
MSAKNSTCPHPFARRQRGVTFIGLLFVAIVVVVLGIVAAKVVPTVIEYQAISKAAQRAAEAGTTVAEIRASFDRSKAVDYFEAISGRDLRISKENDRIVVEFSYQKELHLVGPAYLLLKYAGRTS